MDFTYDANKNQRNILLRRISFARAADFQWATAWIVEDLVKNDPRLLPESPEWTDAMLEQARSGAEVLPELFSNDVSERLLRKRGRPRTQSAKQLVTLRIAPDLLAAYRETGPGWQTRMEEALRKGVVPKSLDTVKK